MLEDMNKENYDKMTNPLYTNGLMQYPKLVPDVQWFIDHNVKFCESGIYTDENGDEHRVKTCDASVPEFNEELKDYVAVKSISIYDSPHFQMIRCIISGIRK